MSDVDLNSPLRTESPPSPSEPVTTAGSLRAVRISKGWSLDDVSARLKFPARNIDALESERWDDLPRGLALKSLVKNYARLLAVNPAGLENALRPYIGQVHGGIANHTSTRSIKVTETDRRPSSSGWILLIVAVVLVAAGVAVSQGLVPQAWVPEWLLGLRK